MSVLPVLTATGQTELIYGLTGLEPLESGKITLCGQDITRAPHPAAGLCWA